MATLPSNQLMNAPVVCGESAGMVQTTWPLCASAARSMPSPEPK
jgi:hypothetical protein